MELTVKVLEQSNMQEFDSRDQSRQGKKIKKLQLELQCGTNRFVADAFGDLAEDLNSHPTNSEATYQADFNLGVAEWTKQETGEIFKKNVVSLRSLVMISKN